MESMYNMMAKILDRGDEAVLVTLCATGGSTPRKAGAKMLVYPDGTIDGTVGGGVLEHEAISKALEIFQTKKPLFWETCLYDLGMICGGKGTLFLEYLGGGKQPA